MRPAPPSNGRQFGPARRWPAVLRNRPSRNDGWRADGTVCDEGPASPAACTGTMFGWTARARARRRQFTGPAQPSGAREAAVRTLCRYAHRPSLPVASEGRRTWRRCRRRGPAARCPEEPFGMAVRGESKSPVGIVAGVHDCSRRDPTKPANWSYASTNHAGSSGSSIGCVVNQKVVGESTPMAYVAALTPRQPPCRPRRRGARRNGAAPRPPGLDPRRIAGPASGRSTPFEYQTGDGSERAQRVSRVVLEVIRRHAATRRVVHRGSARGET